MNNAPAPAPARKFSTRKSSKQSRQVTIARKAVRRAKYAHDDNLALIARELGATLVK